MYIAMNRFQVAKGMEEGFEKLWRERDSYLDQTPGFKSFYLLKGEENESSILYSSHTVWESKQDFDAWVQSDAFRKAHQDAKAPKGTYLGPPKFEGFKVVL
ncbi:MAG: antibiotic biosynthesis monooxygenase [Myxococcota bacterium]